MITSTIIDHLKSFEWSTIIHKGNQLGDLNDRQWRFMKGLVAELIVEKHSGPQGLKYVGEDHRGYDWPAHNLTVELKSQLSESMFSKQGMKSTFTIKFNNSNGTNRHTTLPSDQVADLLIVVRSDGAFVIDRDTVLKYAVAGGDGFMVVVPGTDIIDITGKITLSSVDSFNLREKITDAIRATI
jgi:hypothetical protein